MFSGGSTCQNSVAHVAIIPTIYYVLKVYFAKVSPVNRSSRGGTARTVYFQEKMILPSRPGAQQSPW